MPSIMIVEDDPANASLLDAFCKSHGCDTCIVTTAEAALAQAPAYQPDLMFIDIRLPKMDGLTLGHHLCGDQRTAHIPMIAISANHSMLTDKNLYYGGFSQGFTKPLNMERLSQMLHQYIRLAS